MEPPSKRQRTEDMANRTLIAAVEGALRGAASPSKAVGMKKYMRDQFEYLGLAAPERRALQKEAMKVHKVESLKELCDTVHHLWSLEEREFQYVAMEMWTQYHNLWTPSVLEDFRQCILSKSWWDTIDYLAPTCVGKLIQKFPEVQVEMDKWSADEDLWIKRSAVLHQLKYKEGTNEEMLFRHCHSMMGEEDFFIRKSIGWALREFSKTNPEAVRIFIEENREGLSPLSIKEGSKYLP
jgi:3-methyladenine DNA glycosylase AlkD